MCPRDMDLSFLTMEPAISCSMSQHSAATGF
ncbi:UNVERIFIED_CONTAM: hypothetical protein GTU68_057920 [Idotea baltica]|nr:hypothetical protein [Idotea baltica]